MEELNNTWQITFFGYNEIEEMIYLDVIQSLTGGNTLIQSGLIAGAVSLLVTGVNYFISRRKLNLQYKKFNIDRENFAKELEHKNNEFEEQKKQFEASLRSQQSTTYKELITAERIKWLNELRKSMIKSLDIASEIICITLSDGAVVVDVASKIEVLKKFRNSIVIVKLYLKPNEMDFLSELEKFSSLISSMITNNSEITPQKSGEYVRQFEGKCQELLKASWEEVKGEAKNIYS